jgi:hypothetical protein
VIDFDDLLPPHPAFPLADGWTGWVPHDVLAMSSARVAKSRPWCRGRARGASVEWFPRTSKLPYEGARYGVFSPDGHLPGLGKPGWFVANVYVRTEPAFDPAGEPLGVLPASIVDRLYLCLENVFWDVHRGAR